jgi:hypothetical protein
LGGGGLSPPRDGSVRRRAHAVKETNKPGILRQHVQATVRDRVRVRVRVRVSRIIAITLLKR